MTTNIWSPSDKCVYCGSELDFPVPADHRDGDEYICTDCAAIDEAECKTAEAR